MNDGTDPEALWAVILKWKREKQGCSSCGVISLNFIHSLGVVLKEGTMSFPRLAALALRTLVYVEGPTVLISVQTLSIHLFRNLDSFLLEKKCL